MMRTMRINREKTIMNAASIVLYEDEPFTGELVDLDDDGAMIGLTSYRGGLEHGPQYEWFPDGKKELEGQCGQGSAVGDWREWHENGNLAEYSHFNQYGELLHLQRWNEKGELVEDKKSSITRGSH